MTLAELRRAVKAIGFRVSIKTYSHGQHAEFHSLDGEKLSYNVFTLETLPTWKRLFDWKTAHCVELRALREATGIINLL